MKGKRVLVTGASGLVAFPVARELARDNVFADIFGIQLERGVDPIGYDLETRSGEPPAAQRKPGEH